MPSSTPGAPARRIVDLPGTPAEDLRIGDYVHDELTPFVVAGFRTSPPHVVAIVARLASGTDITVRYLATHKVDASRMVSASTPPVIRRRHLTLCPPVRGHSYRPPVGGHR